MPETLDETYARTLEEIDEQNWEYAHRLFQCVAAASRPLLVSELAEFLAFDFEAESTPTFLIDWRPEDPTNTVLSICSSFLAVVKRLDGSPVVQFAHFSVKEYLTSARLAKANDTISRFQISMTAAHTIVAQGCLGVLLHLDENVTRDSLEKFPLAEYAAEHWMGHARTEHVSSNVQEGMKRLFDPNRSHLSVWVWIYDCEEPMHIRFKPIKKDRLALHYAAFYGLHDVIKFLIVERSQDVNARGFNKKETSFHVASRRGHKDVVQLLLEHGADANSRDDDQCMPLHLALRGGHQEIAWVLLEHCMDTEVRDNWKCTPLFLASQIGHVELAQALLEKGAETEARDNRKLTPLLLASRNGHVELARVLLEKGADTEARDTFENTSLLLASEHNHVALAQVLLKHGAEAELQDNRKCTPLLLATQNRHLELARVLLEHGVDTEARNILERTPLLLASLFGFAELVQVLLEHGADAKALGVKGRTSLHQASEHGHAAAVQVLLEHGVDANARDTNSATPLHLASRPMYRHRGHPEVVGLLLRYSSDVHARDDKSQTPLMGARAKGDQVIMQLLSDYEEQGRAM